MSSTEAVGSTKAAGSAQPQPSNKNEKEDKKVPKPKVKTNATDTLSSANNATKPEVKPRRRHHHKRHRSGRSHRSKTEEKTAGCCQRMLTSIKTTITSTGLNVLSDTVHAALYGIPCTLMKVSAHLPFSELPKSLNWNKTMAAFKKFSFTVVPNNVKGNYVDFFKNPKTLGTLGTFIAANALASLSNQVWKRMPLLNRTPKFLRSAICLGGAIYLSSSFANQSFGVAQSEVVNLALKTYSFALAVNVTASVSHLAGRFLKWGVGKAIDGAGWVVNHLSWNTELYAIGAFGQGEA